MPTHNNKNKTPNPMNNEAIKDISNSLRKSLELLLDVTS
jgi:hypothetical protein